MRGFLTALLLCAAAGLLFANTPHASLLRDGPTLTTLASAEAGAGSIPSVSLVAMR